MAYVVDDVLLTFQPLWFVPVDASEERWIEVDADSISMPLRVQRWATIGPTSPTKTMRNALRTCSAPQMKSESLIRLDGRPGHHGH